MATEIPNVTLKFGQMLDKPSKYYQRLKNLGKLAKFCQVWSHWF